MEDMKIELVIIDPEEVAATQAVSTQQPKGGKKK